MDVLPKLGTGWAGVTQFPNDCPDAEIARLDALGVRAVRFNLFRGRLDSVDEIAALATRVHAVAGWHAEIYADAAALAAKNGIEPHAGHGLTFDNVQPIAAIAQFAELNIGHYLIGEAIFIGLEESVRRMRELMDLAR